MFLFALIACNTNLDADSARAQLDAPTAHLSAATLPQITDDFLQGGTIRGQELGAQQHLDGPSSTQARSPLACALGTFTSIRDQCRPGNECTASITFHSCLLDDPNASGKIKYSVTERTAQRYDRGTMSVDFKKWTTSRDDGTLSFVDGLLEIESTRWSDRDEFITTADFDFAVLSGEEVVEEQAVRGALRIASEDVTNGEEVTAEVLGWVDEDGDGEDDGSVVIRVRTTLLDEADHIGTTFEIVDAAGVWSCSYTLIEDDGFVWSSAGACTDPSGQPVSFEGVVKR